MDYGEKLTIQYIIARATRETRHIKDEQHKRQPSKKNNENWARALSLEHKGQRAIGLVTVQSPICQRDSAKHVQRKGHSIPEETKGK